MEVKENVTAHLVAPVAHQAVKAQARRLVQIAVQVVLPVLIVALALRVQAIPAEAIRRQLDGTRWPMELTPVTVSRIRLGGMSAMQPHMRRNRIATTILSTTAIREIVWAGVQVARQAVANRVLPAVVSAAHQAHQAVCQAQDRKV